MGTLPNFLNRLISFEDDCLDYAHELCLFTRRIASGLGDLSYSLPNSGYRDLSRVGFWVKGVLTWPNLCLEALKPAQILRFCLQILKVAG